jgi:phosphate transport system substrate-binding protein
MRQDGLFVEAGENDNLIVQKLEGNRNAFGIFGYAFVERTPRRSAACRSMASCRLSTTIASGEYTVSRPLFIYAKKQHVGVIPGMAEFVAEYTSEKAIGEDGYLTDKGLVDSAGCGRREDPRRRPTP